MSDLAVVAPESQAIDVERARDMLARCVHADEAKAIRDAAHAIAVYRRERDASIESQNLALEIARRAERRMGELLAKAPKAEGGRPRKTSSAVAEVSAPRTIPEHGITHKESATWQKLAAVPEPEFEARVSELKATGERITTAAVLAPAREVGARGCDHGRRKADVLRLHREGLGTQAIAEALGLHPSTVSAVKLAMGVGQNSAIVKMRADVDRIATMLSGASLRVEQVADEASRRDFEFDEEESKSWTRDLQAAERAVRRLRVALSRKKTASQGGS